MKITVDDIRQIIHEEVTAASRRKMNEDFARGIVNFVPAQVAGNCIEDMRRHLLFHVNQVAQSTKQRREMTNQVNATLKELEKEVEQLLQDRLTAYIRQV